MLTEELFELKKMWKEQVKVNNALTNELDACKAMIDKQQRKIEKLLILNQLNYIATASSHTTKLGWW